MGLELVAPTERPLSFVHRGENGGGLLLLHLHCLATDVVYQAKERR